MPRQSTAVALAALILVSGIGGLATAAPTDSIATGTDVAQTAAPAPDTNATAVEAHLADRLDRFDLTDDQVAEVADEVERLRADGASRLVIRSAVIATLYEFGVAAPMLYADPVDRRLAWLEAEFDLTDDQVAELRTTIEDRRADGADRHEIREAVLDRLESYGIPESAVRDAWREARHDRAHRLHERADRLDRRAHRLHHDAAHDAVRDAAIRDAPDGDRIDRVVDRLRARNDLTADQAAAVEATIREGREAGQTRAEIREDVAALLDSDDDGAPAGDGTDDG